MISLPIDPKSIKPKERGRSDFFSWMLYRYVKKYNLAGSQRIYRATTPETTDPEYNLYIGDVIDQGYVHGIRLRELCRYGATLQRWAYGPNYDAESWVDITEQFWQDYFKRGVCAIHGDLAHKWNYTAHNKRECEYCKKRETMKKVKRVVIDEVWSANT